jgi:cyclopropane fatty-acyl-phospholipid synthase-like methyltransferase
MSETPAKPVALEPREAGEDGRRFSPSVARNRKPILDVFTAHVATQGRVLEIASGTGEHGAFLSDMISGLNWTFSDVDSASLDSQRAWVKAAGHDRLHGPLVLDASLADWGAAASARPWDVLVSINMIHIAHMAAVEGLFAGAGRLLSSGGRLFLYGPFGRDGIMAPSNERFSEELKRRDPEWGVRDLDQELLPLALLAGLARQNIVEMPANNLAVILERV